MVVSSACMIVAIMMQTVSIHRTPGAMVSYSGGFIGALSWRRRADLVLRRREAASKACPELGEGDGSSKRPAWKASVPSDRSFWSILRGSCFARAPQDEGGEFPRRSLREGSLGVGEALPDVVDEVGEVGEQALHGANAAGVDREIGAHAGAQVARVLVGAEAEAQGHPLDDLDPVAARVLRRQDRELRARARSDRTDRPVPDPAGERIDRHGCGLAGADIGHVRLFRVGVDPEAIVGDDSEYWLPGGGDPAEFDLRHLRRHAVDRGEDFGVAQVALRVLDAGLRLDVFGEIV